MCDTTQTQRIIRDYFENLSANKLDNWEEMNKFFIQPTKTKLWRNRKAEPRNY